MTIRATKKDHAELKDGRSTLRGDERKNREPAVSTKGKVLLENEAIEAARAVSQDLGWPKSRSGRVLIEEHTRLMYACGFRLVKQPPAQPQPQPVLPRQDEQVGM